MCCTATGVRSPRPPARRPAPAPAHRAGRRRRAARSSSSWGDDLVVGDAALAHHQPVAQRCRARPRPGPTPALVRQRAGPAEGLAGHAAPAATPPSSAARAPVRAARRPPGCSTCRRGARPGRAPAAGRRQLAGERAGFDHLAAQPRRLVPGVGAGLVGASGRVRPSRGAAGAVGQPGVAWRLRDAAGSSASTAAAARPHTPGGQRSGRIGPVGAVAQEAARAAAQRGQPRASRAIARKKAQVALASGARACQATARPRSRAPPPPPAAREQLASPGRRGTRAPRQQAQPLGRLDRAGAAAGLDALRVRPLAGQRAHERPTSAARAASTCAAVSPPSRREAAHAPRRARAGRRRPARVKSGMKNR
jgi:hypothetical protein